MSREHESWMMMSVLVSLCAMLAVGILVLPVSGARVAGITAAIIVGAIVAACYLVCVAGSPRRISRHWSNRL